jgi:phosphoribosylformylglycinamidine synthase
MKFGVITFPDFDCGKTLLDVFNNALSVPAFPIWHKETKITGFDAVFLSGGSLWLEYIKETKLQSPVIEAIFNYTEKGNYLFGFGEGFRLLCMMKLLPGKFEINKNKKFISKNVFLRSDNSKSALTALVNSTNCIKLPLSCLKGNYKASEDELISMRQNKQILFRYCDESCNITEKINHTGSIDNIAAVSNKTFNIFGIMPGPEKAVLEISGNSDGRYVFESILATIR